MTCENKTHFNFTSISTSRHLGPDCIVYPINYATIIGEPQRGLQVLVNLGQQEIKLQQGTLLGHFQRTQSEEIMITQDDIFGLNIEEPWTPEEIEEEVLKGDRKGFITSPADVDPREPIKLRDAEVAPQHREAFENLCSEYEDIFSKDSADLGKTPLLKMDIPTGQSTNYTKAIYPCP